MCPLLYTNTKYRYVIVDRFLSFIAKQHEEEIDFLRKQIKEEGYSFA